MFSTVIIASGSAIAINAGHAFREERDPFPVIIAGGIFTVAIAFVNEASSPLASGLAMLFLLSTILLRGAEFFDWLAALVSPK